jgi:hypothetical protein
LTIELPAIVAASVSEISDEAAPESPAPVAAKGND